jgi:hypothetical protein
MVTVTSAKATKSAASSNAKKKAPTKTETMRKIGERMAAKAKASPLVLDLDKARANCVSKTGESTSAARVYAHALIAKFGPDYYTFTTANCRTDNEKAHLAGIEEERKRCQADYAAKYGAEGQNMPWSRAKAIAKGLREGNEPRAGKPLDVTQRTVLTSLYKKAMKEERPTETELAVNDAIGRLLISAFKIDLSTLG